MPDLAGPAEFFRGDRLLEADRALAEALDGVHRRGEVYLRWFQRLSSDAGTLADPAPGQLDRLISIQHALADIIEFLDPSGLRFPREHLTRLPPAGAIVTLEPGPAAPAEPAADAGTPT